MGVFDEVMTEAVRGGNLVSPISLFDAAKVKPAVIHVESHPYLPEWELLDFCRKNGIVLQVIAALGRRSQPSLLEDPIVVAVARRVNKTPADPGRPRPRSCSPGRSSAGRPP